MGLTNFKIKSAAIGKRHHDGGGLYLTLSARCRGKWTIRYMINRKAKEIGLGRYPELSLADARKKHFEARILIAEGKDPLIERRKALAQTKREALTRFSDVAESYIEEHRLKWTNKKHAHDWKSTLGRMAYPVLDQKPLAHLATEDVIRVLKPIWYRKHETARKLQGRIKLIFGYAKAGKLYVGENPAAWQDHLCHYFPVLSGPHHVKHHRSLHYGLLPGFFAQLVQLDTIGSKALQYTILTAARTSEVRCVRRDEIDFKKMLWNVPPERMKARKPHKVPLSHQTAELIDGIMAAHNYPFLFHGLNPEKPLSNMAMLSLLKKRYKDVNTTVHGFRSTFRTWASDMTEYNDSIMEFALAHQLDEKVEGAYNRTELVEKRRPLMQDWADYAYGHATAPTAIVH